MTAAVDSPFEIDLAIEQRLRGYVDAVATALGVGWASCALDLNAPRSAYVAMDRRLRTHPDRDLALLWDERHGWTAGVETHSGEDLILVSRMGGPIVPPPRAVVEFAGELIGGRLRSPELPERPAADPEELLARLDRYAHTVAEQGFPWAA